MDKLEQRRRAYSVFAVALDAKLQRHGVGLRECAADKVVYYDVRVFFEQVQRIVAVIFVHSQRKHRAQSERAHKLHQHPDARLLPEALRYLLSLVRADSLYRGKLLPRVHQHIERAVSEFIYYK